MVPFLNCMVSHPTPNHTVILVSQCVDLEDRAFKVNTGQDSTSNAY